MIQDKSWSPFVYQSKILWSYSIEPHVVCENDIDLMHRSGTEVVDCVLCVTKYNSTSPTVFEQFYHNIHMEGYDEVITHLNGAPAYLIQDQNVYLGLLHVIKTQYLTDAVGRLEKKRMYAHYFYTLEAFLPFRVTAIASKRVKLAHCRSWSPWFKFDDIVEVEFAMYMQYHPDRKGQEIVISYGDGDRNAHVNTFGMEEVWSQLLALSLTDLD